MIDSHCHLAAPQFSDDLDAVLARAKIAGVERMICIGDTTEESERGRKLAEKYEQIFCTVGLHPHQTNNCSADTLTILKSLARCSKKVRAIGEIGLDYHYDFSPRDIQQSVFREQLQLAKELELPAVIHCREAVEDVWTIVDDIKPPSIVLHCCTEQWEDVERFAERGYLLSFTGIATYPHAQVIRETIRRCPLAQLMIETDAPYLAPVPHRGERNEPAFVVEVAKLIAKLKDVSFQELDRATTENAIRFFDLPV